MADTPGDDRAEDGPRGKDGEVAALRAQIAALLADALRSDEASADAQRVHDAETVAAQHEHDEAIAAAIAERDDTIEGLQRAIASRDLIGQAKGVIMAALHCSPEEAFSLLVKQSQAENRKLVEIAADIASNIQHRPRTP